MKTILQAQQLLFNPSRLPRKPYCVDEYGPGIRWRIRQIDIALRHLHVQPNCKTVVWRLIFDIDRPGAAFAFELANLPPPNWTATNPDNGHAHLSYEVVVPVSLSDRTTKSARLLIAIERAFGHRLGADQAYSGAICKNPLHPHWKVLEFSPDAYTLTELAEWVAPELAAKPAKGVKLDADCYCIGRNFTMFEHLRKWAYRAVRDYWRPNGHDAWHAAVRQKIDELWAKDSTNWSSDNPAYSQNERDDTAKSVASWVWLKMTPATFRRLIDATHTPELQAARGKLSGQARLRLSADKRGQAAELRSQGMSQRAIADDLGVPQSTIASWLIDVNDEPISEPAPKGGR